MSNHAGSDVEDYEPLGWRDRIQTMPTIPGPGEQWIHRMAPVLEALVGAEDADETVSVPGIDEPLAIAELVKKLGPSLVSRRGNRVALTEGIRQWMHAQDPERLILHLHRHVRLVGELLCLLSDGPRSHDELRVSANSQYCMNWAALDQVRKRTTWLRASGHVELYDGAVHLTAAGAALLDWLPLGKPDIGKVDPVPEVTSAHPVIDQILSSIGRQGHNGRSEARSLLLPSPEGVSQLEVLKEAVHSAISEAGDDDLDDLFQRYGLALVSARQARASLKSLGLIERVRMGRWTATDAAAAWLESNDDLDLVRIAHARVWFVGEILQVLNDGPADAATVASFSAQYGREALRVPGIRSRFALLRACGVLEKFDHQRFQLTLAGRALLKSLPIAVRIERVSERTHSPEESVPPATPGDTASLLSNELIEAMHDSRHPKRFELAVHDALDYLGLDVEHLSGSAQTDVAAVLPVPAAKVVLAVEAKTSADGPVSDHEVSSQRLREHRAKIGASTTVLVGPEFHRHVHAEAGVDARIAVLHAQTLADAVVLHSKTPFSPRELQVLFDTDLTADQRDPELQRYHGTRMQLLGVLGAVITQLELEMRDENPMYEGNWLGPSELRRDLRSLGTPHDTIVHALHLLSSPFIGVLEEHKGRFRLVGPGHLVTARLQSAINNLQLP
ncbi:hypothetical protein [Nocardia cyriacigeorgica]|uniref:hypothetical protein n=1 Tax=Nocardia cyriacigeorgica TaxID=135487 RepID=UPI00245692F4|nr:hypothetical protein [Nocardia cyriacigeorgica]